MARVAFIVDEMFEDSEFRVPFDRLRQAGHDVVVVGSEAGTHLEGKRRKEHLTTALSVHDVSADEFDQATAALRQSPAAFAEAPAIAGCAASTNTAANMVLPIVLNDAIAAHSR